MKILAFDYGLKKVGVAISIGILAEPFAVLREKSERELFEKAAELVLFEKPDKIIVGISEREIAHFSKTFGDSLALVTKVPIEFVDETLSTFDAQQLAIAAGMRRKKRHDLEDAFSAAVILQRYLDSQ